jgi:glycopeptide antibiotics resistance protein
MGISNKKPFRRIFFTFPRKPEIWRFLGYSITLVIIYFSLNPSYPFKQTITNIPFGDQAVHFCAFGFLMYCFCQFWKQKKIQFFLGFGLMALGFGLETLQSLRGGAIELEDAFANTLGVGLGSLIWNLRNFRLRRVFP